MMMDSVENRAAAAAGDEGVSLGGLEKEAVIDGSMNFSSDGIQAFLNSMVIQPLICSVLSVLHV